MCRKSDSCRLRDDSGRGLNSGKPHDQGGAREYDPRSRGGGFYRGVEQLVARLVHIQEVVGSTPISAFLKPTEEHNVKTRRDIRGLWLCRTATW